MTVVMIVSVAFFAAGTQAISGFGFSILAVPALSLMLGPTQAIVIGTALSGMLTFGSSVSQRAQVAVVPVLRTCAAALCGIPVGLVILQVAKPEVLMLIIGAFVILSTLWYLLPHPATAHTEWGTALLGAVSGASLSSTGVNGPPLVIVFQSLGLPPAQLRASLQAVFVVQDALATAGFAATGQASLSTVVEVVPAIPLLVAGWMLGNRVFGRLGGDGFRLVILTMLLLSGGAMLYRALRNLV